MSTKIDVLIENHIAEGMEGLLADAIRKHPILYDKNDKYRSPVTYAEKHRDAWNRISDELNLEVESCKTLWSCIKQKFIKYRKKLDNGESFSKEWPIYGTLRIWLDRHIKKRRTRNDMYRQIRTPQNLHTKEIKHGKTSPTSSAYDNEFIDDIESAEWNEVPEERDDHRLKKFPIEITALKRKQEVSTPLPKRKMKIEVYSQHDSDTYNENDTEIFAELDRSETEELPPKIVKPIDTLEILKLADKPIAESSGCRDVILEANFDKLEQVIGKCVNLAEKCIAENSNQDSNEMFGKFIASLVRDLPLEKRMKVRFEIIQFTGELIAKEIGKS